LAKTNIKKDARGFSLVELCILLGMVMLVSAFAIPSLSSAMRGMQLSADARNIASALSYAKLSAISQMKRYRVSFILAENRWQVEKFNSTSGLFEAELEGNALSTESGIAFKTDASAALTGYPAYSSNAIIFNSRGIPVDDSGVPTTNNVVYISKADSDFAVSVSLTGKVQVWKYSSSQWCSQ
jgi:Tfp pilus assembly protein FimT